MLPVTPVQAAVESFREAALLPERWPAALDSISSSLRSDGATLLVMPTRAHMVAASTVIQPFVEEHFKLPFPDPREHRVTPRADQGFMADQAYFSAREIARDPYYQEFLVPRGFGWNAVASLGGDLFLSLKRGNKRGRYDADDISELDAALPWMRAASRAASLTWRSRFSGQLEAFERLGRGAILIDARARVLEFNSCVRFGDGFDASGGYLQAARPADRTRLERFLLAITSVGSPSAVPTTLALPRLSGLRPWLLDGICCTDALRSLHSSAAALVLITDIARPARIRQELLREMFFLTHTEAILASEIAAGRSLRVAAQRLAISEGHARQRLKQIFLKTGTSGQVELVALLGKLH
jgi:DNA-binding CsgD family transcriptional regulator